MPHPITVMLKTLEQSDAFFCVACGHDRGSAAVAARPPEKPFELWRCDGCGLVQQFPRWNPARINSLYGDDYYVFSEKEEHRWARAVQQYVVHLARFESSFTQAARVGTAQRRSASNAIANCQGPRLLDVGCALGHLAALARMRGWRVTGVDISADAISQAAVRFGLDVRAGNLSSHVGTLAPYDVVLLGDVIEHVPDPVRFLNDVKKVLLPGGTVCIDTPNWGGRWRRWGRSSWLGLNRFHVNLFDADCLARLLSTCGFRDIAAASYTHYRYEGWSTRPELQAIVRKLPSFLSWRIIHFLENRKSTTRWSPLRERAPANMDDALARLAELGPSAAPTVRTNLVGDNLVMTARR